VSSKSIGKISDNAKKAAGKASEISEKGME